MTWTHALLVIFLCAVTGSFTWGMRGTILGGERGAMLPGAALALVLLFSGRQLPLAQLYPMAATAGAAGMFFGGSQTYGETISLSFNADAARRRWGRLGLAVKGAGWFGVFGGIFSFGLSAFSGRFHLWQVVLFVGLLPVVKWLGVLLLNYPQKPKENRFPKIYFSETRFEVWGGMAALCIYLIVFGLAVREWLIPVMTAFGMLFGAVGFFIGNLFQTALDAENEKKKLFSVLHNSGFFSGWKGMECIFGAIGGLGLGTVWCIFYTSLVRKSIDRLVSFSGMWDAFGDKTDNILLFVWLILFALFVARYMFRADSGRFASVLHQLEDIWIYPVFCYIPLFLAATGNVLFSQIFSFTVLLYLLADKIAFSADSSYSALKGAKILQAVLILLPAVSLALQLFTSLAFSAYVTFAMYLLAYFLVFLYSLIFNPEGKQGLRGSLGWMTWASVCVIILLTTGSFFLSVQ